MKSLSEAMKNNEIRMAERMDNLEAKVKLLEFQLSKKHDS